MAIQRPRGQSSADTRDERFLLQCADVLAAQVAIGTRLDALAMLSTGAGSVADASAFELLRSGSAPASSHRSFRGSTALSDVADAIAVLAPSLESAVLLSDAEKAAPALVNVSAALRDSPAHSAVIAPVRARGETVGVLTLFVVGADHQAMVSSDRLLAADLARGVSRALHDARVRTRLFAALHGRDRLLAENTHEIRNCLAALLLSARLLEDSKAKVGARPIDAMKRTIERTSMLVDDLVRALRIDGDGSTRRLPCAIEPIIDDVLESIAPVATAKAVILGRSASALPVPALLLDADLVAQLVTRLVDHSLGRSREGGFVRVTVSRDGDWVVLRVGDDGIGIDPQVLAKLFGGAPETDLSSCRWIVEAHGGTIDAESTPGGGTQVRVRLPIPAPF